MPNRSLPRPTTWQDTRTKRAVRGTSSTAPSGSTGITIGDPVTGGVPYEFLCCDAAGLLAQSLNARYKTGWSMFTNIGKPALGDLNNEEFVFSFETATP